MPKICQRYNEDEFCNMCARYIHERYRKPVTELIQEMYLDIYGFEMNLEYYAPTKICWHCENSLDFYVKGKSDFLKIKKPARWGEFKGDHSNCFFHLVQVRIQGGCYKTILPNPERASFFPPEFSTKRPKPKTHCFFSRTDT